MIMSSIIPPFQLYQHFDPLRFTVEIIYSLVVAIIFFYLYKKTMDLYKLSSHEGIKFFRLALLFFAVAFASRLLFSLTRLLLLTTQYHVPGRTLSTLSLIIVTYTSTLAIGYLIYSLNWKKIKYKTFLIIIQSIALLAIIIFYSKYSLIYFLAIQLIMMLFLLMQKAKPKIKLLYSSLSLFWIFNIIIFYSRRVLGFELKLAIQVLSLVILGYLVYKILKWAK